MHTTHKFDAIATHALGQRPMDNEVSFSLFRMAWELDECRARLISGAEAMAGRFANYHGNVAEGRVYEPPTGYSTLRDLDRDYATFSATLKAFTELFHAVTGKTVAAVAADLDELAAADKAVAAGEVAS
jgi:hypothetical protein